MFGVTVLVAMGGLLIAFMGILKRLLLKNSRISPLQFLVMGFTAASAVFATYYLFRWGFSLPKVLPGFWKAVFLGAAFNVLIQFLNARAASLQMGEVSLTAPLQAMTPGLITMLAIALGEFPGRLGVAGIVLMAAGTWVLLWDKKPQHWWEYLGPLKRLGLLLRYKELSPVERSKTLAVTMALGSATLGTFGLLCDGLYTRRGIDQQGLVLAALVLVVNLATVYSVWYLLWPDNSLKKSAQEAKTTRLFTPRLLILLAVFGLLWVGHVLLIQPNFNHAIVAYVGTLKRLSVLLSVLMGWLIFREGEIKKRLLAAALVVAGAVLISFDGLPTRLSDKVSGLSFFN